MPDRGYWVIRSGYLKDRNRELIWRSLDLTEESGDQEPRYATITYLLRATSLMNPTYSPASCFKIAVSWGHGFKSAVSWASFQRTYREHPSGSVSASTMSTSPVLSQTCLHHSSVCQHQQSWPQNGFRCSGTPSSESFMSPGMATASIPPGARNLRM